MKVLLYIFLFHILPAAVLCSNWEKQKQTETGLQDTIQISLEKELDLFATDDMLHISLEFNVRGFLRGKADPEYMDAILTLHFDKDDSITQELRIRQRGNYRRSICQFPPIMINPRAEDSSIITQNRNIKLVTHCRNANFYEEYVLREYLIYKLYNLVSDYSFRVRLAQIDYIDENDPDDIISRYGFLIENLETLAERTNAVILDNEKLMQDHMMPLLMARLSVFEFMIGNEDWQLGMAHNIKTIKAMDIFTDKGIPIPYDFDFAGLVDAPYSIPRENLDLKDIRQRYFQGICAHKDQWNDVLNEFEDLKDGFYNLVNGFELLDSGEKQQVLSYLDEFYFMAGNRDQLLDRMSSECTKESEKSLIIIK